VARPKRRHHFFTRPDKAAVPAPDLIKRDFTAPAVDQKWSGDLTEIPTEDGKAPSAAVEDLPCAEHAPLKAPAVLAAIGVSRHT